MTLRHRTLKALSALLPAGALGMSVALASAPSDAAMATGQNVAAPQDSVAARLQAIRRGVSAITQEAPAADAAADANIVKVWWGNGGWGNGGWRWRPGWGNGGWRPGWGNGGWGNGGWRNGGWRNFWHNW